MKKLHSKTFGSPNNPPIIFLHGMLGALRNWQMVAKKLSDQFYCICFDLRNHGESFHDESMTFDEMAEDVVNSFDQKAYIVGHSLGGKVALKALQNYPERFNKAVILDIFPKDYEPHFSREIELLDGLKLDTFKSRREVDIALESRIPDFALRQFLLTNLSRQMVWTTNIKSLIKNQTLLAKNVIAENVVIEQPTLFIKASGTDFITSEDRQQLDKQFLHGEIVEIESCCHNPHLAKSSEIAEICREFLSV